MKFEGKTSNCIPQLRPSYLLYSSDSLFLRAPHFLPVYLTAGPNTPVLSCPASCLLLSLSTNHHFLQLSTSLSYSSVKLFFFPRLPVSTFVSFIFPGQVCAERSRWRGIGGSCRYQSALLSRPSPRECAPLCGRICIH